MRIMLKPGETLIVGFTDENEHDGDGTIVIEFEDETLRVSADMPDSSGREGVIYEEWFGDVPGQEQPVPGWDDGEEEVE